MRKLTSEDFNGLDDDMMFDDVEVQLSSRHRFIMRPLSVAMINAQTEGDQYAAIRFSISDAPEPGELDIEFESVDIAGRQYRVATKESIERLNPRVLEALMEVVRKVSYLSTGQQDKTDFTSAGDGTETPKPTASE